MPFTSSRQTFNRFPKTVYLQYKDSPSGSTTYLTSMIGEDPDFYGNR